MSISDLSKTDRVGYNKWRVQMSINIHEQFDLWKDSIDDDADTNFVDNVLDMVDDKITSLMVELEQLKAKYQVVLPEGDGLSAVIKTQAQADEFMRDLNALSIPKKKAP